MEFDLLAAAAMAAGAFWLMVRWEAKRGNAAGCALDIWDVGIAAAVGGLFIGRLVAMISVGINPITNPAQIVLVRSGVSTVGASIGAIAVFAFLARKDLFSVADAIAPAVLAGLAGWHAGCLATDGCLGTESSLPWALALDGSTVTRHPVELYAATLLAIAAYAVAAWKQYGRPPILAPAGVALLSASAIRLATEPMRISLAGGPAWLYISGVAIGAGIVIAAFVKARGRSTRK
jgi:prolipoprotein diacylglyceryltransferase